MCVCCVFTAISARPCIAASSSFCFVLFKRVRSENMWTNGNSKDGNGIEGNDEEKNEKCGPAIKVGKYDIFGWMGGPAALTVEYSRTCESIALFKFVSYLLINTWSFTFKNKCAQAVRLLAVPDVSGTRSNATVCILCDNTVEKRRNRRIKELFGALPLEWEWANTNILVRNVYRARA